MITIANAVVTIQTSAHSAPSPLVWFGELTVLAQYLNQQSVLDAICECVRFARRRFGRYDVIDIMAVLFGYAISGERTLQAFYEQLQPYASAFIALALFPGPSALGVRVSANLCSLSEFD
jgi:hypothetical protein